MRISIIMTVSVILSGCNATAPAPNLMNGQYYMAGDSNCVRAGNIGPTRIACFNSEGQPTGYRDAMTSQQIQMYQFQVIQAQIQAQQIQQSIDQNNAIMAANTQSTLNRAATYSPPIAQPVPTPGGNQVRCIGVGIYTNCRW